MQGEIFNIQRFCVNDGPGIRTTVFFKGCPLSCPWCHNPESQHTGHEVLFYADKCLSCRRCKAICKNNCHDFSLGKHVFHREACNACMACTELFCGALEQAGKTVSCEEVMKEVLSDAPFYASSGGGITLSGGEPLMQAAFALALLKSAKEQGLHTAVETCGFASADCVKSVAVWTDLFLFDYKETQKEKHLAYTSADRRVILENLALLNDLEKDIVLRCPIVPGYNDRVDHFEGIAALANAFTNILHVEVEPYHPLGEGKYQALGRKATAIDAPGEKEVWSWMDFIQRKTDKKVVKA